MATTTSTVRTLAGGLLVEVDPKGKASPLLCTWLVRVASGNPEPDSIEDTYRDVDCGARLLDDGHGSYHCEAGHSHVSFEDPRYADDEAAWALRERRAEEAWD